MYKRASTGKGSEKYTKEALCLNFYFKFLWFWGRKSIEIQQGKAFYGKKGFRGKGKRKEY